MARAIWDSKQNIQVKDCFPAEQELPDSKVCRMNGGGMVFNGKIFEVMDLSELLLSFSKKNKNFKWFVTYT